MKAIIERDGDTDFIKVRPRQDFQIRKIRPPTKKSRFKRLLLRFWNGVWK